MNTAVFSLTEMDIKLWCYSDSVFKRGSAYFREGRVIGLIQKPDQWSWQARVEGSEEYLVFVDLEDDGYIEASCDCPAFESYGECKHIVAVLLAIAQGGSAKQNVLSHSKSVSGSRKYAKAGQIIDSFMNSLGFGGKHEDIDQKQPLNLEYICRMEYAGPIIGRQLKIELKAGMKRNYVVKNLSQFLQSIEEQSSYFFTNNFSYNPTEHTFLSEDLEIIQLLQQIQKQDEFYLRQQGFYNNSYSSSRDRSLVIPPLMADMLMSKLEGRNFSFEGRSGITFVPFSLERKLPLAFCLGRGASGDFELDLTSLQSMSYDETYGWVSHEDKIYKLSVDEKDLALQLYRALGNADDGILPIDSIQMGPLVSHVVPALKRIGQVKVTEQVSDQIIDPKLTMKIWLDEDKEQIQLRLEYHYGSIVLNPFQPGETAGLANGIILMREVEKEQAMMQVLESTSLTISGANGYIKGEEDLCDFLYTFLPKLQSMAEVYMTNAVKTMIFPREQAPVTRIDVDAGGDLLEINFDMEGLDRQEVRKVLQSIVEKKKYHRLSSGAFVPLQEEAFQSIDHLFAELQIPKGQVQKEVLKLPLYRGLQIEEILAGKNKESAKQGKRFRRLLQDLKNPDTLDHASPEGLQATLRTYQQFGFSWLKTMAHYRLGGILADDMGLGKTLQAIAYLLSEKQEKQGENRTSLVVCPASLVYNWKREFEKFAPELEVMVVYGSPEERISFLQEHHADVFITSYPLLRQDLDVYEKREFDSLILDEAQAIKNHLTKTAKAVKEIKAARRFALSGTPIENSLDELWSIFDAILPGFFPSQKSFRNMERDKLAQLVRPFILRRLKSEVLKELPEKIETVHLSELTKEQKQLYLGYLEKIREETKGFLQTEGFEKNRIKILAGLTRLRQLCCHPSLFLENYQGESGKLEQFMEIIENALENKRRILVFSQFTSMLQLIAQEFKRMDTGCFYLDGQTPSQERVEMAERFNQGENQLFLISLKAGGTGLNLTGADTVILYDLWWNPAVEEQAAGRAHRMGQKKSVQVMRLIARGTIEEKIYEIQQKKKELIEQVIQPGEAGLSSLSEREIREILGI